MSKPSHGGNAVHPQIEAPVGQYREAPAHA